MNVAQPKGKQKSGCKNEVVERIKKHIGKNNNSELYRAWKKMSFVNSFIGCVTAFAIQFPLSYGVMVGGLCCKH